MTADPHDVSDALVLGVRNPRRLRRAAELRLSGHLGDAGLDAVVETLAAALSVPVAVVNVVAPDLQTYPAEIGVGQPCTTVPDALSFCAHVVDTGQPLHVSDASSHPVYSSNPMVQAGAIGAYAGSPLVHDGVVLGAVSVFEARPRRFTAVELQVLRAQARLASVVLSLRWAATHDPLTGLPNRAHAVATADEALAGDDPVSALFIDLDDFKGVNDRLGHSVGDDVLRDVAAQLRATVDRSGGLLARWGGDEFVVVLPHADRTAAEELGSALTTDLRPCGDLRVPVSVTVGVSTSEAGDTWDQLVRDAGTAAAAGKAAGKCTVRAFTRLR